MATQQRTVTAASWWSSKPKPEAAAAPTSGAGAAAGAGSGASSGAGGGATAASSGPKLGKSGKKICCSCPQTRKARDECIVLNGEDACRKFIEAHKVCLRQEGFHVP